MCFLNAGKEAGHGKSFSPLMWTWGSRSAKWNSFGKLCEAPIGNNIGTLRTRGNVSHCSTVERLYAWEEKLYLEVKVLHFFYVGVDVHSLVCCQLRRLLTMSY